MTTMSKTIRTKLITHFILITWSLTSCSQETLLFKTAHWRLNSNHTWLKYIKTRKKLTNALRTAKVQYLENLSTAIHSPCDFRSSYHKLSPKRQCTQIVILNLGTMWLPLPSAKPTSQPIFQVLLYLFYFASVCWHLSESGKQIWPSSFKHQLFPGGFKSAVHILAEDSCLASRCVQAYAPRNCPINLTITYWTVQSVFEEGKSSWQLKDIQHNPNL